MRHQNLALGDPKKAFLFDIECKENCVAIFILHQQSRVKQVDGISNAIADLGEVFGVCKNVLCARTPSKSLWFVQGESSLGRSATQTSAERFSVQAGSSENSSEFSDFSQ